MKPLDPTNRKRIRENIADFLLDISDVKRTKLEWSGKVPGVMRMYAEDVEAYFTDCLDQRDLEWNIKAGLLTREEADILQPFHEAFKKFVNLNRNSQRTDIEIANDPSWKLVSEAASEVHKQIGPGLRS